MAGPIYARSAIMWVCLLSVIIYKLQSHTSLAMIRLTDRLIQKAIIAISMKNTSLFLNKSYYLIIIILYITLE